VFLLVGPGLLVGVVALAIVGRGVAGGIAVDRAVDVARAEPSTATGNAPRLASDAYVNRFTIDDAGAAPRSFVTTPPWVHALGIIGRDRSDPFQR
jgi:hypothetical protein